MSASTWAGLPSDVEEVGRELSARLERDHDLLTAPRELSLWRAHVLLGTAKLGRYEFSRLREPAIGVELLSLATEDHYGNSGRVTSLRILGGDRRYATGLACICSAGRPELVEIVADALAEIAQSQASDADEISRMGKRRGSVLAAAARLGACAAEVPRETGERVAALAQRAGMAAAGGKPPTASAPDAGPDHLLAVSASEDFHPLRLLERIAGGSAGWT